MDVKIHSFFFDFQLIEAVVLPMTHKERFEALGIQPPKGWYDKWIIFVSVLRLVVKCFILKAVLINYAAKDIYHRRNKLLEPKKEVLADLL